MNIWVKKEQEDKIMQRIGLDKNWDFYESDESMSFVFATPPSQKVDLPHDFIVGKPRSADRQTDISETGKVCIKRRWISRKSGKERRSFWISTGRI